MSSQKIEAFCRWCNEPLSQDFTDKCPRCGKEGKAISAVFKDTITLQDFFNWAHVKEYYEENTTTKLISLTVALGSPFIGLLVSGWFGVLVGIGIGIIAFLLPPWTTKIREITKSQQG